jgi:hypothetical protein
MAVVRRLFPFPQRSFSLLTYFFAYRTKLLNVQYRQNFGNTFMNSLFICDHSCVIRQIPLLPVMRCYCSNTPICKALHSNNGRAFLPFPLSVLTPISYIIMQPCVFWTDFYYGSPLFHRDCSFLSSSSPCAFLLSCIQSFNSFVYIPLRFWCGLF